MAGFVAAPRRRPEMIGAEGIAFFPALKLLRSLGDSERSGLNPPEPENP